MELIELCAGAVVIACIAAVAYLLTRSKPVKYEKRLEGGNTCLAITANQDLAAITVTARFDSEEINFERKRIRKGQSVEFVYPHSSQSATLTVQAVSGKTLVFEV